MAKSTPRERRYDLYRAIAELEDFEQCKDFFEDLCSMNELLSMEQRFEVAKMLNEEKVYTEIMESTGASTSTISRVKRVFNYGTGCMANMIRKLQKQ